MRCRKLVLPFVVCVSFAFAATTVSVAIAAAAPRLEPVDGGPGYYGRFAHSLPTSPRYFPVGVWFESATTQRDVNLDKDAGLNLYVVLTATSDLPLVRRNGMKAIVQSTERSRFSGFGTETAGWELLDEIDMTDGPPGGNGFQIIENILTGLPADGRLRFNNYGKGVLLWQDDPWPAQWVNRYQQVVSTDLYWFTDPNQIGMSGEPWLPEHGRQMSLSEIRRAANYGYQIDRLRALDARDGVRKPIWAFVEVGWPFTESAAQGARAIAPAEIRAAVWQSLIAGARGVIYFNHSFGGPCQTQHVLRDECGAAVRPTVKAVNRQIHALAPVLNAPTVTSGWTASASVRAMVKWYGDHLYVFAGARANQSSTGRIAMRCVGDATAVRLGEPGAVAVRGGSFGDSFPTGNAVHIYRIDGGSTCGLRPGSGAPAGGRPHSGRRTRVGRLPRRVSLRSRRLVVRVTCATKCTVRSRLTTRRKSRRITLAAVRRRFAAGRHKVVLRLSRRDRRLVAGGRVMRLRTVIVERGGAVQRTQRLVARR